MDANAYLGSFDPLEQQRIRASWAGNANGLNDWYRNAVAAGAVQGQRPGGTVAGMLESGWEDPTGKFTTTDFTGVAQPSDWLGKRMPTPAEARLWAQQQHAAYVGGNRQAQDEDWNRYSDQQIGAWLNEGWDPAKGGWKQGFDAHGQIMPWAQSGTVGSTASLPAQTAPQAPQPGGLSPMLSQWQGVQQPAPTGFQKPSASMPGVQSSLSGVMGNWATNWQGGNRGVSGGTPGGQQPGWSSTSGLQNMLSGYQGRKTKPVNSWF